MSKRNLRDRTSVAGVLQLRSKRRRINPIHIRLIGAKEHVLRIRRARDGCDSTMHLTFSATRLLHLAVPDPQTTHQPITTRNDQTSIGDDLDDGNTVGKGLARWVGTADNWLLGAEGDLKHVAGRGSFLCFTKKKNYFKIERGEKVFLAILLVLEKKKVFLARVFEKLKI